MSLMIKTCVLFCFLFITAAGFTQEAAIQTGYEPELYPAPEDGISFPWGMHAEAFLDLPVHFINWNYALGLSYFQPAGGVEEASAITGISKILLRPSGFSARNPEQVTYWNNNWMLEAGFLLYNGVEFSVNHTIYKLSGSPQFTATRLLGKHFLIGITVGGRLDYLPAMEDAPLRTEAVADLSARWLLHKKRYKP